ncbi:hypothetical protein [Actinoplanes sp. NPDC049802]|uniref:hypothetical protein n=1 Tax=Actinoplanes sp. NPDC049802 TaxID=3154742 RepID=UPI00340BA0C3
MLDPPPTGTTYFVQLCQASGSCVTVSPGTAVSSWNGITTAFNNTPANRSFTYKVTISSPTNMFITPRYGSKYDITVWYNY